MCIMFVLLRCIMFASRFFPPTRSRHKPRVSGCWVSKRVRSRQIGKNTPCFCSQAADPERATHDELILPYCIFCAQSQLCARSHRPLNLASGCATAQPELECGANHADQDSLTLYIVREPAWLERGGGGHRGGFGGPMFEPDRAGADLSASLQNNSCGLQTSNVHV